jgi:hypothetical protein
MVALMPPSRMAMSTSMRSSMPSIFAVGLASPPTRRTAAFTACAGWSSGAAEVVGIEATTRSTSTDSTAASERSRLTCLVVRSAANPPTASNTQRR